MCFISTKEYPPLNQRYPVHSFPSYFLRTILILSSKARHNIIQDIILSFCYNDSLVTWTVCTTERSQLRCVLYYAVDTCTLKIIYTFDLPHVLLRRGNATIQSWSISLSAELSKPFSCRYKSGKHTETEELAVLIEGHRAKREGKADDDRAGLLIDL